MHWIALYRSWALVLSPCIRLLPFFSNSHLSSTIPRQRTLSIHRVVQTILKEKLTVKQRRQWVLRAVRLVSSIFLRLNSVIGQTCEKYFLRLVTVPNSFASLVFFRRRLPIFCCIWGSIAISVHTTRNAETYLTYALELCEQTMGLEHLDTAHTLIAWPVYIISKGSIRRLRSSINAHG